MFAIKFKLFCEFNTNYKFDFKKESPYRIGEKMELKMLRYIPNEYFERAIHLREYLEIENNSVFVQGKSYDHYTTDLYGITRWNNMSYAVLRDVTINGASTANNGTHCFLPNDYPQLDYIYGDGHGQVVEQFDSVIAFGHMFTMTYGHWFLDYLSPMQYLPQSIYRSSTILNIANFPDGAASLDVFGISLYKRRFSQDGRRFFFTRQAYVLYNPIPHVRHFGTCLLNLSNILCEYYKLNEIKPTKFGLSNRKGKREAENWKEICDKITKKYPEYDWVDVQDGLNISESAKHYASLTFLYAVTGSGLVKIMYMHSGSVVVDMQLSYNDHAMQSLALCKHILMICYQEPGLQHHYTSKFNATVSNAMKFVGYGIDAWKLHKLPPELFNEPDRYI